MCRAETCAKARSLARLVQSPQRGNVALLPTAVRLTLGGWVRDCAVSSHLLGDVERGIGTRQEVVQGGAVKRIERYPDRGGDRCPE